jgi:hypothetical protein
VSEPKKNTLTAMGQRLSIATVPEVNTDPRADTYPAGVCLNVCSV